MRTIIAGSRDFTVYGILKQAMEGFEKPTVVLSGNARGADQLGERWARENNIRIERYIPNWHLGRGAGFARNIQMAQNAERLIAFWDGNSRGTKHMIDTARAYDLIVEVVRV